MRTLPLHAIFIGGVLLGPAAQAASGPRYGSFGIGIGTGGLGVDFAYPLHEYFDLRLGYDFGSISETSTEDDVEYDAKLKFSSARLLADYKPFAGGFRISAGMYTGTPEIEAEADGLDDYEIGENEYRGDLRIDGDMDLGGAAPYLGIGWGGTAGRTGFGASFDIGVIFGDSPQVNLDVSGTACDATLNANCDPNGAEGFNVNDPNDVRAQQFQADKDAEIAELEDDAKDFDLWPVIRFGLHYRF